MTFYTISKGRAIAVVLPGGPGLLIFENILQFLGAFVGLSIAVIAIRGYRATGSPTLLRLATAFVFLLGGFAVEGLVGLNTIGFFPQIALIVKLLVSAAAFLQAAGYFFLFFSHAVNVRVATRLGIVASLGLPLLSLPGALQSLSLFFVLYGSVETAIYYIRMKKTETLVISIGLGMIALSTFLIWVGYFYPYDPLVLTAALIAKVVGFLTLLVPVLKFSFATEMHLE